MEPLDAYRVSRLAQADIEGIYDYTVKNWSIGQADVYYDPPEVSMVRFLIEACRLHLT